MSRNSFAAAGMLPQLSCRPMSVFIVESERTRWILSSGSEYIQDKLANRQVDDFQPMGRLFHVPAGYGERESKEKGKEMLKSFSSTPPDKTP